MSPAVLTSNVPEVIQTGGPESIGIGPGLSLLLDLLFAGGALQSLKQDGPGYRVGHDESTNGGMRAESDTTDPETARHATATGGGLTSDRPHHEVTERDAG